MNTSKLLKLTKFVIITGFISVCSFVSAEEPEYMSLDLSIGNGFEFEGYVNEDNIFYATDIEKLPKGRKPKLRGPIEKIDVKNSTITMFGKEIRVTTDTEFIDSNPLAKLEVGQRIQVSCRVKENQIWKATKIKTKDVKNNNKIKGTLTKKVVDGKAVDTLEIEGLKILIDAKTDVNDATSHIYQIEKYLFGDLRNNSIKSIVSGYALNDYLNVEAEYRNNILRQQEYDLSPTFKSNHDDSENEFRGEMTAIFNSNHAAFAQLRIRKRYFLTKEDSLMTSDLQSNITQLFYLWKNIGTEGLALSVGRQDFEEPREWLFDDYLDAVRVFYYSQDGYLFEFSYIDAVNSIKDKFDTWTDLFGMASYYPNKNNVISAYYLKRSDTSIRNREPVWYGLRYIGELQIDNQYDLMPWCELSISKGEDKGDKTNANALDLGATFAMNYLKHKPSFTIGYAKGSGDDPATQENEQFRQTGYQDNVDKFNGKTSVYYYGVVLDPELSNLKVLTLAGGIYYNDNVSLDIVYHKYTQVEFDNDLKGSDLIDPPAQPNGASLNLGWGMDFVLSLPKIVNRVNSSFTLGIFNPGDAYNPYLETALLGKLNLNIEI